MIAEFLHRITTKIRRLGYAREHALFLAGFLVTMTVAIAVLMGILRAMQNKTFEPVSGRGTGYCGQTAALQYYPPFGIQRQMPA